ncbi:MAG TPA: dihydrolipoamide acetyltransferase family protein [Thermodesulfobacteriota bacterium]|nr:dihydrolipoamide acetyltransferase family protein [Thermodesulfobacteriota bacterium]
MARTILMPKLGVTMEEGKIVEWKKKEGDFVQKGEILLVIESDKVALEYEAPESGVLGKIIVSQEGSAAVGQPICIFTEPGEKLEVTAATASEPSKKGEKPEVPSSPPPSAGLSAEDSQSTKVVPLVRKLAGELGISLNEVKGTGPGGRITKDDLLKYDQQRSRSAAAPATPQKVPASPGAAAGERRVKTVIQLTGTRGTIAKRMTASFQNPQGTQFRDIDATETLALWNLLKEGVEKGTGQKLTFTALLVKTLIRALQEHPLMNSIIEEGQIKIIENINMGVASAVEGGLIVPVIHDVQNMTIGQIAVALAALGEKAKGKKLSATDIRGGTFTLTNMGMFQAEHFTPLLNPPEAAVLAVGAVQKKAVVINDEIQIRPILPLSLAMDHRAIDGAPAAQFFARLKELLETPCRQRVKDIVF